MQNVQQCTTAYNNHKIDSTCFHVWGCDSCDDDTYLVNQLHCSEVSAICHSTDGTHRSEESTLTSPECAGHGAAAMSSTGALGQLGGWPTQFCWAWHPSGQRAMWYVVIIWSWSDADEFMFDAIMVIIVLSAGIIYMPTQSSRVFG